MKKHSFFRGAVALFFALALSPLTTLAETPQLINYQGHVSDSSGQPLDTTVSVTFSIYSTPTDGSALWSEMHPAVISNGFYNVNLGTFVSLPNDLFDDSPRYLGVTIGSDAEISPRTQLVSVPYGLVTQRIKGDIETAPGVVAVINQVTSDTAVSIDSSGIDLHGTALVSEETSKAATGKISLKNGKLSSESDGGSIVDIRGSDIEFHHQSFPGTGLKIGDKVTYEVNNDTTFRLNFGTSPSLAIGSYSDGSRHDITRIADWIRDDVSGKEIRRDITIVPTHAFKHAGDSGKFYYDSGDFVLNTSSPTGKFKLELGEIGLSSAWTKVSGGGLRFEMTEVTYGNDLVIKKAADSNAVKMNWEDIQLTVPMYTDKEIIFKNGSDSARISLAESVGPFRKFTIEPSKIDFPDVGIKMSNESLEKWLRWYGDHFVIGPSGEVVCSSDVKLKSLLQADVNSDGLNDFVVSGVSPTVYIDGGTTLDCAGSAVFSSPVQVGAGAPPPPMSKLHVNGDFTATGAKLFVQDHPTDPEKEIVYVALEGGEAGTYTRGSAQLESGVAEIELPDDFVLVTNERGLTVQITPTEMVNGMLYVSEKSRCKIVVKASNKKDTEISFDFIVNGVRVGFENHQPIRNKAILAGQ